MKLIYHAQIIEFNPPAVQPYQKPRALNWRYQVPGETYNNAAKVKFIPISNSLTFLYRLSSVLYL